MSNWSSFEKEKAYTDRWRLFLEQEQEQAKRKENEFDHGDYAFVYTEIKNTKGQIIQPERAEQIVRTLFAKKDKIALFDNVLLNINRIIDSPDSLSDAAKKIKLGIRPRKSSKGGSPIMVDSQGNPFFSAVVLQACFFVGLDEDQEILKHLRHMQKEQGSGSTNNASGSEVTGSLSAKDMIKNASSVTTSTDSTGVPPAASITEGFNDFLNKMKNVATAPYQFAAEIFRDLTGDKKYSETDKAKINRDFMLKARTLIAMYITKQILN